MAALTAARLTKSRDLGPKHSIPVAASTTIYAGGMVMINSSGYAAPAAVAASNLGCWGVAIETVDNSSGSNGDLSVLVQEGTFKLGGDTLGQDDIGKIVYADDDQTVDETGTTNAPCAGVLVEYIDASNGWVRMGVAIGGSNGPSA